MTHRDELRKIRTIAEKEVDRLEEISPLFLQKENKVRVSVEWHLKSIIARINQWEEESRQLL